jgi:hypothetical protein
MPQGSCPRCGAATQPLQQYCLECGTRLPRAPGLLAGFAQLPTWLWTALVFLVISAAATAGSVAAAPGGGNSGPPTVIATQPVTVGPGTRTTPPPATSTIATTPPPTLTTGSLPTAPGSTGVTATTATTAPAPPPPAGGLVSWPAGKRGYTDVLESIPAAEGRAAALARARAAQAAGLPRAGVLLSSDYASLRPGYWVVFSGIYAGADDATSALAGAHAHGFPDAYPARVSP